MAQLTSPKRTAGGPAAPAKKTVATVPKPSPDAAAARLQQRTEGLIGVAQIGAFLCTVRGRFADVGTINAYATETCQELAAVGEENEMIGKGLDMLAAAGPYTKLLTVALPFTLQLMANSGQMDWKLAQNLGVIDPKVMAARAIADIEKMAQEAQEAARLQQEKQQQEQMRGTANGQQQQQPAYG